ncbi:MAG: hypothetical protein A2499_09435 [Stygiobacter sp. RIFOXYC12_FULL_38_8]|nr:MAG: hypothetical protein A2X62_07805 [Stygiobacter sp. GWC2_38_9]OGV06402.1 MAG: hypothetical protein A2299_15030 [Stygiobacter sp. RIFOXYB2_FULL_37_11]OGV13996.1 MAG: hypothetical protein A2440_18720 [Stygiobacter sp. RIFOXYC2_FULL_38_25]OGV14383.1 MAG: hypothetical protein A2237_00185 [Stygiobacter sp. RIFOXYA2_FULL_38_8]OGV26095.1 MAG: hypothetical protein A2499_09435 [Stygiobacter sp. RIFOXYC12_FULL_38_8]OGV82327.1 MAG: hypothetical protein A2X65_18205 [Stygiobacter sp. GWF2_38_21]
MKKYLIIIIGILFLHLNYAQDSTSLDTSKYPQNMTLEKSDSITYGQLINDSTFFEEYQGLIGAFIGALSAALIAFFSINKTHKKQIALENEKIIHQKLESEKKYCGILFSIYSILTNHYYISTELKKEIDAHLKILSNTGKLFVDKPYNYLPIDLLKDCTSQIYNYEKYDSNLLMYIVTYVSKIEIFFNDLNFIPLIKMKTEYEDDKSYVESLNGYFAALLKRLEVLDGINEKINSLIKDEINKSSVCDFREMDELLHNQQINRTP